MIAVCEALLPPPQAINAIINTYQYIKERPEQKEILSAEQWHKEQEEGILEFLKSYAFSN